MSLRWAKGSTYEVVDRERGNQPASNTGLSAGGTKQFQKMTTEYEPGYGCWGGCWSIKKTTTANERRSRRFTKFATVQGAAGGKEVDKQLSDVSLQNDSNRPTSPSPESAKTSLDILSKIKPRNVGWSRKPACESSDNSDMARIFQVQNLNIQAQRESCHSNDSNVTDIDSDGVQPSSNKEAITKAAETMSDAAVEILRLKVEAKAREQEGNEKIAQETHLRVQAEDSNMALQEKEAMNKAAEAMSEAAVEFLRLKEEVKAREQDGNEKIARETRLRVQAEASNMALQEKVIALDMQLATAKAEHHSETSFHKEAMNKAAEIMSEAAVEFLRLKVEAKAREQEGNEKIAEATRLRVQHGIRQNDVKASNFMFNRDTLEVKILDFGNGTYIKNDRPFDVYQYENNGSFLPGLQEVWSLGCMLVEMLFGRVFGYDVFDDDIKPDEPGVLERIEDVLSTTDEIQFSDSLLDGIRGMLESDPSKRISVEEILKHPMFLEWGITLA
ncbi:hypothetical protein HDU76_005845 [Blyttiomyces sp. JEL0837]|nr:hypothetical protein HDU76_005845 [Blyttiomyces sp. JEL0837]